MISVVNSIFLCGFMEKYKKTLIIISQNYKQINMNEIVVLPGYVL